MCNELAGIGAVVLVLLGVGLLLGLCYIVVSVLDNVKDIKDISKRVYTLERSTVEFTVRQLKIRVEELEQRKKK